MLDIAPTVLALLGVPEPEGLDGKALAGVVGSVGRDGLTASPFPPGTRRSACSDALEAIASELGPGDELLVVDNGSADGTGAAAEAFLADVPAGRVVSEPGGGISVARNSALREARHSVVCFVDDDVRVQPGWLAALRSAWSESTPDVACIGGPLLPEWQAPRPAWLADYLVYPGLRPRSGRRAAASRPVAAGRLRLGREHERPHSAGALARRFRPRPGGAACRLIRIEARRRRSCNAVLRRPASRPGTSRRPQRRTLFLPSA